MNYGIIHQLCTRLENPLREYAVANNKVTDAYSLAKSLLTDMLNKSYYDPSIAADFWRWLQDGDVKDLREALGYVFFNEDNPTHMQAYEMLNTFMQNYTKSNNELF